MLLIFKQISFYYIELTLLTFFFINNTSLLCCKSTPNDIYYWRKICIIIVHIFRYNLHFGENELIFAEAI